MSKTDYSDYEKRRAADHEFEWRLTATLLLIRSHVCHFRGCRRIHFCAGPMVPSAHQDGQVRAQKEIGLSGEACRHLPFCVAQASEKEYATLHKSMRDVRQMRIDTNDDRGLLDVFRKSPDREPIDRRAREKEISRENVQTEPEPRMTDATVPLAS